MSKPRYPWWGYAKSMIRRYPNRVNDNERVAVNAAIDQFGKAPGGDDRMRLIEMVLLKNTHTLQGAAMLIPCSYGTAKRWQQQFIKAVGNNFRCDGLKD